MVFIIVFEYSHSIFKECQDLFALVDLWLGDVRLLLFVGNHDASEALQVGLKDLHHGDDLFVNCYPFAGSEPIGREDSGARLQPGVFTFLEALNLLPGNLIVVSDVPLDLIF